MISKKQILNVLKKYGYYSLNRAPYLYENENNLGVYFVWPHKHFGNLERVLFFSDLKELEEEVFKYWWFKENKNKYNLNIELDNYEILSPKVIYKYNDVILTEKLMKDFNNLVLDAPKNKRNIEILKRTARILIQILEKKFIKQIETFENVNKLNKKIDELKKELAYLLEKEFNSSSDIDILEDEINYNSIIDSLNDELNNLENEDDIKKFIDSLMEYMQNLDLNLGNLQNGYLIIKAQYEIEDLNQKLTIVKSLKLKKKKNWKIIEEEFNKIDENSKLKTIIDLDLYTNNEKTRIMENYNDFLKIDKEALGDYLVNFEKLNLDIPFINTDEKSVENISDKNLKEEIIANYEKLTEEQKCACIIANSFLGELLVDLMKINNILNLDSNQIELILQDKNLIDKFENYYHILDNFININIRVKYMKLIKTSTFLAFLDSLKLVLNCLQSISFTISSDIEGYTLDVNKDIINIQLKNLWNKSKSVINLVKIDKNIKLYYAPILIKRAVDVLDNNEIVALEQENMFFFKDDVNITIKNDIGKVANYEKEKNSKEDGYIKIVLIKLSNLCSYNYVIIKDKEQLI